MYKNGIRYIYNAFSVIHQPHSHKYDTMTPKEWKDYHNNANYYKFLKTDKSSIIRNKNKWGKKCGPNISRNLIKFSPLL